MVGEVRRVKGGGRIVAMGLLGSLALVGAARSGGLACTWGSYSARPCGPTGVVSPSGVITPTNTPAPTINSGRMGGAGPVSPPVRYGTSPSPWQGTQQATVVRAPEVQRYLSPACAQLNDAIRTGPARGLRWDTIAQLREEYRGKCREDEDQARQDLRHAQVQQREAQQAEQVARQRLVQDRSRCQELQRILVGKRRRIEGMAEGERHDLERSEAAYAERCGSGS
jgi:hypothetical protein